MSRKIDITLSLEPYQYEWLKAESIMGRSMSQLIRDAIDNQYDLKQERESKKAQAIKA